MGIFKACDIRGLYPDELNQETAEAIGRAIGSQMPGRDCVLCGDVRPSTPTLKQAVCRGLAACGTDVKDIGTAPTPVAYWAEQQLGADGVVIVTASHNPPEYNGVKFKIGPMPVTPKDVAALRRRIEVQDFAFGAGQVARCDVRRDYLNWLGQRFGSTGDRRRVVLDAGSGTASDWAPEAFRRAGYEVEEQFCKPDGRFPHRSPNPSGPETLQAAAARVRSTGAQFAACFDGDADRVVFLDERGEFVPGEQAIILLLRRALQERAGAAVVYDLKCTGLVPREIERCGGRALAERSGHAFIKRRLLEEGAVLGGEVSGHFFFGELGRDDGIYAALVMGEMLGAQDRSLSELRRTIPPYFITDDIRIARPEEDAKAVVDRLRKSFADLPQDDTDGVRIEFTGGWALCRPSVTEPVITLRVEGDSPEMRDRIRQIILAAIGE
jgi:phosphomannomutase/phosphoglucomutase